MPLVFIIFVILLLLLTGALFPLIIAGGWILVVVLGVVLVGYLLMLLVGLAASPFVLVWEVVKGASADRRAGLRRFPWAGKSPQPGDPEFSEYLDWANRRGKYAPAERN